MYQDCVGDYNQVVDQDEECAEELENCVKATKVNQDLIKIMKSNPTKEKWKWLGIGFGVGSLVVTGIALGVIFGSK
ncbi:hypothetical protein KAR91_05150 [Candidatus Pacearchaeota archaeon]|nr:hypothetical protein [Candidatus Pacearchaeota archaeon]